MKADKPKELPKLDIPEDWIIGTDISREILNMYTNFPCRLKAGIFVLCLQGEIEASIDADKLYGEGKRLCDDRAGKHPSDP